MKAYLDILKNCLENGTKSDNRTGIPTIRIPWGATFEHNMENGFPLITTKKMGLKNISTELEFFINGYTDKKWLQDRKCHIWDEWANIKTWKPLYELKKREAILDIIFYIIIGILAFFYQMYHLNRKKKRNTRFCS